MSQTWECAFKYNFFRFPKFQHTYLKTTKISSRKQSLAGCPRLANWHLNFNIRRALENKTVFFSKQLKAVLQKRFSRWKGWKKYFLQQLLLIIIFFYTYLSTIEINNEMKIFVIKKKWNIRFWKPQPSEPPWSPDSYLPNKLGYFCLIKSPLKMIMRFISSQGLFSFLRYLHFCLDFFAHGWKWFDKKAKINFKIYDLTNSNTNNKHIVKVTEKARESDNEIWSVSRI